MHAALAGKTAVITGASRGIGRQMALDLSAQGVEVALLARPSDALDEAVVACGRAALAIPCDVGKPSDIDAAFRKVANVFGRLDILINNAAICRPFVIEEATDEEVLAEISVNLCGPIFCTRAALPFLRASNGDIINISSESVRLPFPHLSVYTATKAGLEAFSAGMRDELRPLGIRVTTLRIGNVIGTAISRSWSQETAAELEAAVRQSGHAKFTGAGGSPETISSAVKNLLTMKRDFNVDLMEIRSR